MVCSKLVSRKKCVFKIAATSSKALGTRLYCCEACATPASTLKRGVGTVFSTCSSSFRLFLLQSLF